MWPVIGHEWAIELLNKSIRANKVSHAYLFVGPSQIGKTTLAKVRMFRAASVVPAGSCEWIGIRMCIWLCQQKIVSR